MNKQCKQLYRLTILFLILSGCLFWLLQQSITKYQIESGLCMSENELLLMIDDSLKQQLTHNHFIYYQGKKVLYTWQETDQEKMLLLHLDKTICQKETITISISQGKQSLFVILLESWRKE